MIISNQEIEITVRRHDVINYYKNKGYDIQSAVPFKIKVEDLMPGSRQKIWVKCDYCGKPYQTTMNNYTKTVTNGLIHKCACFDCGHKKNEEVHLLKYGVRNAQQLPKVREKAKKTNMDKYGVDNVFKLPEVREKAQNASIEKYGYVTPFQNPSVQEKLKADRVEKYGVEYIFQSAEFKKKAEQTCMERYGGSSPMSSSEIREKSRQSCLAKYGCEYSLGSDEVQSKCSVTRFLNGTCITTKEQERLLNLFNGIENYPIGRFNADILLPDNVVLEYDGGAHAIDIKYGRMTREEFDEREKNRSDYIMNKGYSIIRFINTRDLLITDEEYLNALTECKKALTMSQHVAYDFSINKVTIM